MKQLPFIVHLFAAACVVLVSGPAGAAVDFEWLLSGTNKTTWQPPVETVVTATSTLTGSSPTKIVDNSGMTGTVFPQDLHDSQASTAWQSVSYAPGDTSYKWIQLDLGMVQPLGKMLIWNLNRYDGGVSLSARGVRYCYIGYSTDGVNFTWLDGGQGYGGLFELAKANNTGAMSPATNQTTGPNAPVDFKGAPGRYVRFWLTSNWGGVPADFGYTKFGLSEVRVYRHASLVDESGDFVAAKALQASPSGGSINPPESMTNNYGMSDAGSGVYTSSATINTAAGWWSVANEQDPYIIFDLGGTYPLDSMAVWNFNAYYYLPLWGRGIKKATIYHSVTNWGYNADSIYGPFTGWQKLDGPNPDDTWTFNHASSSATQAATDTFDFGGALVRYVMIVPNLGLNEGNWGGAYGDTTPIYGLSQARFFAGEGTVVEPVPRWTAVLGQSSATTNVWSGADQGFSIPYPGPNSQTRSLFTFADTFTGKWVPTTYQRGANWGFPRNTLADWSGGATLTPALSSMSFKTNVSMSVPVLSADTGSFYWPYGGIYLTGTEQGNASYPNRIFILASRHANTDSSHLDNGLVSVQVASDGTLQWLGAYQTRDNHGKFFVDELAEDHYLVYDYGSTFLETNDWIYIYGRLSETTETPENPYDIETVNSVIVGRFTKANIRNFSSWEFYAGSGNWVSDFTDSVPITPWIADYRATVLPAVDPAHAGEFMMVTKEFGVGSITIAHADNPWGPFENFTAVYAPPENNPDWNDGITWSYTVAPYPELSAAGELLMSYSVNGISAQQVAAYTDIYRQRFVRMRTIGE